MTDRYDDRSAPEEGVSAEDDTARSADAHALFAGLDSPDEAHGVRSASDTGDIDRDAADAHVSGQQLDARAHVNARRSTHTELPDADGDTRASAPGMGDAPQYGVGPFSVREVALLGIWAVTFLVSFFPLNNLPANVRVLGGGANVWLSGLWWIPAVALPTVAVGLLALRRLSPQGIRRVGSLGIDQFASVAFSVAALVWVAWVWDTVSVAVETGIWTRTWVVWVGAVFSLAGVVLTVFAPIIPPFEQDFQGRPEAPAHRNARPVRAVVKRPARPRPVRTAPAHDEQKATTADAAADRGPVPGSYTGSTDVPHGTHAEPATSVLPTHDDTHDTDVIVAGSDAASAGPTAEHDAPRHPQPQAFWALAPTERDVVDDYGTPIFRIGPTAWALVIEDRGETFVIRHDDGRIGYLHEVGGVTRG
ncbi:MULTISPECIES: hypothetical protein [Microbacterium]|uniref:Uncharacterized protein n=1 Tax=Microbacterium mcarthurae TaxID=3035918 RepID=A0ABW9GJP7_9MICO|nr:hypothetical protein [Microbacterium sp. ACRRU]MCG7417550.1 hypothetical protein [Microbacterium sp. ACRRU]